MLELLDNKNPLLRQSCISWLQDASTSLFRIIDPLLETLINSHNEAEI